jgi:hypothetical protein
VRTRLLLLVLIATCAYALAANHAVVFPAHLSGEEFVQRWRGAPGLPSEWPVRTQQEQVYAQGYLDAVVDLTQGQHWCSPAGMQPGERDDRVITMLKKAKAQDNAAKLLLDLYVARFPCQ